MRARLSLVIAGLALAPTLACQDDTTVVPPSETETSSSSTTNSADSSTGEPSESESESGTETETETGTATETGEPEPYCGDGNLDYLEECDDGNDDDLDGCSNDCVSACGTEFWIDIALPSGWFDVQTMRTQAGDRVDMAGDVALPGSVGRLRYVSYAQEMLEFERESGPLGQAGTMELPRSHQIVAVEIAAQGDLLALGRSTEVLVANGPAVESYWLARFDGGDLSAVWRVDLPGDNPDFAPRDIAVLDNGDPVITRTVEIANNDTDVELSRHGYADGAMIWTASFSGEFDGGWSLDTAARVATGPGDRLWAAGVIRVNWETFNSTVIEFDPQDGAVLWSGVPLPDPGKTYEQYLWDLAGGPNGEVAVGVNVLGPASSFNHSGAFMYDANHELAWSLTTEEIPWEDGTPYVNPRVAFRDDGNVVVAGTYTHDFGQFSAARPFILEIAPDGTQLCEARVGQMSDAAIVPRNGFFGGGRPALNLDSYGIGGMGPGSGGNWLVGLRGLP